MFIPWFQDERRWVWHSDSTAQEFAVSEDGAGTEGTLQVALLNLSRSVQALTWIWDLPFLASHHPFVLSSRLSDPSSWKVSQTLCNGVNYTLLSAPFRTRCVSWSWCVLPTLQSFLFPPTCLWFYPGWDCIFPGPSTVCDIQRVFINICGRNELKVEVAIRCSQ